MVFVLTVISPKISIFSFHVWTDIVIVPSEHFYYYGIIVIVVPLASNHNWKIVVILALNCLGWVGT